MNTVNNYTTIHLRLSLCDLCVPNKTNDLNLGAFNIITGKNGSKTLTKHIPCECKCKLNGKNVLQSKSRITINMDASATKYHTYVKKIIFGILLHVPVEMVNLWQLLLLIQLLCVMKLLKKQRQFQQILMKKAASKTQNVHILLAFLLLLIAVSIYCFLINLIKYKSK